MYIGPYGGAGSFGPGPWPKGTPNISLFNLKNYYKISMNVDISFNRILTSYSLLFGDIHLQFQ
jgi:hypothetical protein